MKFALFSLVCSDFIDLLETNKKAAIDKQMEGEYCTLTDGKGDIIEDLEGYTNFDLPITGRILKSQLTNVKVDLKNYCVTENKLMGKIYLSYYDGHFWQLKEGIQPEDDCVFVFAKIVSSSYKQALTYNFKLHEEIRSEVYIATATYKGGKYWSKEEKRFEKYPKDGVRFNGANILRSGGTEIGKIYYEHQYIKTNQIKASLYVLKATAERLSLLREKGAARKLILDGVNSLQTITRLFIDKVLGKLLDTDISKLPGYTEDVIKGIKNQFEFFAETKESDEESNFNELCYKIYDSIKYLEDSQFFEKLPDYFSTENSGKYDYTRPIARLDEL